MGDVGERAVEEFGHRSGRNLLTGVPDADVGVPIASTPACLSAPQVACFVSRKDVARQHPRGLGRVLLRWVGVRFGARVTRIRLVVGWFE